MGPFEIAARSLRANILALPSGRFLVAGQNQFKTLWTRDFCHSARGLLVLNEDQVVHDHLSFLLSSLRSDGLVPRVIDNRLMQFRVAWQSVRTVLSVLPELAFKEPLRPQYTDEHGSHAIDSNLLVLLAALQLRDRSGGGLWWDKYEEELRRVWSWYEGRKQDGLIVQTGFADWQDSVRREGRTFLTNFLYFIAGTRLKKIGWNITDLDGARRKIDELFFDQQTGVYRSLEGSPVVSVDGNLLALEAEEFLSSDEKKRLWSALKNHPVVRADGGHIGRCSVPDWPRKDIVFHVRLANLHEYHGSMAWSWLMGLGMKVAKLMGDEETVRKQRDLIGRVLERDREVVEIFRPDSDWKAWESWLLKAERPFSWGAAYIIDALAGEG